MKKICTTIIILLVVSLAYAHEFWLQPSKFIWIKNQIATIDLMNGEDYMGSHVTMSKYRIHKLGHYYKDQQQDLRTGFNTDSVTNFRVRLETSGGHLFAFNTNSRFIEIEAPEFNNYLRSEGLDYAAQLRAINRDTMKAGRELYQRCAKTLLQVDNTLDQTYALNTGMRLEIIPGTNPYQNNNAAAITFKVLLDNRPLRNSLMIAWHTVNGQTTHTTQRSNSLGEVSFPIDKNGKWMISVVHMIPHAEKVTADWQSFWGSYTFGYE